LQKLSYIDSVVFSDSQICMATFLHKSQDQKSGNYLHNIFMQAPVSLMLLEGDDFTITLANERVVSVTGISRERMLNLPFFEVFPDLMSPGFKDLLIKVLHDGETFRVNEIPLNKALAYGTGIESINVVLDPIKGPDGNITGILAVGMDVTELVRSRKREEETQVKYKKLFDAMDQAFFTMEVITDHNNNPVNYRYLEMNPAFERLMENRPVIGLTARDVLNEYADFWIKELGEVAITGHCKIVSGEVNRYYEAYAFPIGLIGSNQVGVILIDKSESKREQDRQRKFAEQLQREVDERTRELKRSNKELLSFARLTSHDLKEPVRKIETFVRRLVHENESLTEERRNYFLSRILVSVERIKKMIIGVQHYTQIEFSGIYTEKVDLNTLIAGIISDNQYDVHNKPARYSVEFLPVIEGSKGLLFQLFNHLIANSLKFARKDVITEIAITSENMVQNGVEFVNISITDNGIGFEPENSEYIFETFSRLHPKDMYEGAGLGLTLSKRIANKHGGIITATSFHDIGSRFNVILPLKHSQPMKPPKP